MIFLSNTVNFKRQLSRKMVNGYNKVVIADNVNIGTPVTVVADDNTRTLNVVPDTENKEGEYLFILTTELGLFGGKMLAKKLANKQTLKKDIFEDMETTVDISFIAIDNEYFIVKLRRGAIALNIDGKLIVPNIGIDASKMKCKTEDILWINAMWFEAYRKYAEFPNFFNDFERFYYLCGGKADGCAFSKIKERKAENIDLSMGNFAMYKAKREAEAERREYEAYMKAQIEAQKKEEETRQKVESKLYTSVVEDDGSDDDLWEDGFEDETE